MRHGKRRNVMMGTVDFIRASENLEIGLRGWPIGFCQGYPFEVMRKGTIKFCLVPLRLVHARPHLSNPAVALTWVRKGSQRSKEI